MQISIPFAPELVIVNDATRPTPTSAVLDMIWAQLGSDTRFLVATGTHRPPTEDELGHIFGSYLGSIRTRIDIHDCRNMDKMVMVGITAHCTDVILSRLVVEAERILVIGSVEPHYFAGYTGGRKAFLPGTAAYGSIEQNHRHALDPASKPLALKGNPVHDDAMEALQLLGAKRIFSIQAVLDRDHSIYAIETGNMTDSFNAAVKKAEEVYILPVKKRADIIVARAGAPFDTTLYQAHKAIENTKGLLNHGGIMILVADCAEGIGNDAFVKLLSGNDTPENVIKAVKAGYKLGYHKAAKLAELVQKNEVWVVSSLPEQWIRNIFMTPFTDVKIALQKAKKIRGAGAEVLEIEDAAVIAPCLK